MFASPTEAIVSALRMSKRMLHRFVDDLKPHEFEVQASFGTNCIAWLIGHLAMTDRRSLGWLGARNLPPLPPGFEEKFLKTGRSAESQTGFGDPKELIALFDEHRDRMIEAMATADPALFLEPPSFQSPMFADKGEAFLFMSLHTMMHLGQISSIRRSLGYPPIT